MWLEFFCGGFFIFKLFRRFFFEDDIDDVLEAASSDSAAILSIAKRLESIYSGKVYVGLRIPDADTGLQQDIDMVVVTKGKVLVISVKNFTGFASIDANGTWVCTFENKHKVEHHPDPVEETKRQLGVLESYLQQRGVSLPVGYLSCKVIFPNPMFCTLNSKIFPREVITYDDLKELKADIRQIVFRWIKRFFCIGGKEIEESAMHQKLNFVLSTAPMWDTLELSDNKSLLGEFVEFKGKQKDMVSLGSIKRSKVSKLVIQKLSMFGLAHSKVQVLYGSRHYGREGASPLEWKEITVDSSTEIVFRQKSSSKPCKFKISKAVCLLLSA